MSFWKGFAQAYKDVDEKKTREKLIAEEREWATQQKVEDRTYESSEFDRRFQMETAASQQALREKLFFEGKLFGGGTSTGGSRSSTEEPVNFRAFMEQHPELDEETIAMLAPYPDALALVHKELMGYKAGAPELGHAVDPTRINQFVRGIVPDDPEGAITEDRIREQAQIYGIDVTDEEVSLLASRSGPPSATVITDPGALTLPKEAVEKEFRSMVLGDVLGDLQTRLRDATRDQDVTLAADLREQIEIAKNRPQTYLNTPEGTSLLQQYWEAGWTTSPYRAFTGFTPTFQGAGPDDPNLRQQVKSAIDSGFIQPPQNIRVIDPTTGKSLIYPIK